MNKVLLQTWSASLKMYNHVAIANKVLELKADRGLFARIAVNFRPDMHLQECLSNYELSIVPILLFAADETMLYCSAKSKLMDILEKMSSAETSDVASPDTPQPNKCVAIIHIMADVQSMDKRSWIKTCNLYKENMMNMMNDIILFDRYDTLKSLRSAAKHLWLGDSYPVAYHSTLQYFKCSTEETVIPHSNKG